MIYYQNRFDKIYQYLILIAFFLLPITVVGNNIAIWILIITWILINFNQNKIKEIFNNKLAIISTLFFILHLFGLIWTDNLSWGLEMTRKMLPFMFVLPIFLLLARKQNFNIYINAYLAAIFITILLSYLVWFEIIIPFKNATVENPTPFTSHISHNPMLAFAFYLIMERILFNKNMPRVWVVIFSLFALAVVINMFITGGRAGQMMFFFSLVILTFQYLKKSRIKAFFISIFLVISIVFTAYNYSPIFQARVNAAYDNIINYEMNKNTSVGHRITFILNSYEMFIKSPIIGVGTGDFPDEYEKINKVNSPEVYLTVQPHNMYLLVLTQLGLLGFSIFLYIFVAQYRIAIQSSHPSKKNIGLALPLLFLLIMLSDSYLLGHFTGNLFILFSSILYSKQ
jgi:O-antigen ligase